MLKKNWNTNLLLTAVILTVSLVLTIHYRSEAASKPAEKTTKSEAAHPASISFSKKTECASCHKVYVESMKDPKMLMSKHADITGDCFDCHKESAMKAAHVKVTKAPRKFFRQRKYPNDLCVMCHGDYDSLVEMTKESTVYTTVHGDVINPHDTHVGQVECFNCHKMHKDKPPIEYCYGCHHPRQLNNCKDCHAPKKE